MLSDSARITYSAGIPSGTTGTVTLFNSVTAFPPGGSLHLLGQQWFQFSLRTASAGGTATGTVTGSYSNDKGTTWLPFYTKATADAVAASAATVADVFTDEVYIGSFKDVRFQYTNAVEALTVFEPLLSLHVRKPTSKVSDGAALVPFDPVTLSVGAVTSWLRNVTLSGAISTLPDMINNASPATQGTAARQPTGNADGTMSFDGNDCLVVPFNSNTISTTTQGFCFWMKLTGVTSAQNPFSMVGAAGGSTSRGRPEVGGVNGVGGMARTMGSVGGSNSTWAAGTLTAATWQFVCHEYDGGAALGSRMNLFVNGALITPTADTSPAALTATSGTWTIGALDTSGTTGIAGQLGRNFFVINSKMSGATQGLLTSAARAALMAFEPPT